jgi:hypothetical protein
MPWTAHFFEREDGTVPARDFLETIDLAIRMRLATRIEAVEQNGYSLGGGIFEVCHGYADLYEIRVKVSRQLGRVYCTVDHDRLILISGLVKTENEATPRHVLEEASAYVAEYRRTRRIARE